MSPVRGLREMRQEFGFDEKGLGEAEEEAAGFQLLAAGARPVLCHKLQKLL